MKSTDADEIADILDYDGDTGSQSVIDQAESINCSIVYSSDTTLLLDLDKAESLKLFMSQFMRFRSFFGLKDYSQYRSRHGNWHIIINLIESKPIRERILLQLVLGSDPVREGLSLKRVDDGDANPSILLKPKNQT